MNYYNIILNGNVNYKPLIGKKPEIYNDLGYGNYDLQKGTKIDNWDNRNKLYFEDYDIAEDYLPTTLPTPVISDKIKVLMENLNIQGVQFLPIKLEKIGEINNEINGYYVLNILNIIDDDIIDQSISKRDPWSYSYVGLYKDKLLGLDIFRIRGYEVEFFISERLKLALEKSTKLGVIFKEVELS